MMINQQQYAAAPKWTHNRSSFHESLFLCRLTAAVAGLRNARAQQPAAALVPTTADPAPTRNTSYIDAQGTAHVTRVVPVPKTISPEAQRRLSRPEPDQGPPQSLAERRKRTDAYTARARVAVDPPLPQSAG